MISTLVYLTHLKIKQFTTTSFLANYCQLNKLNSVAVDCDDDAIVDISTLALIFV
jgi:hypothetical protein